MAYIDQGVLALDATFQKRVQVAMLTTAKNVQAELSTTANHPNRANYAKLVLNNPAAYLLAYCEVITTNAVLVGTSLDSDIQFTSDSIWNSMAGVI